MPEKGYKFKNDKWGKFTLDIAFLTRYECELKNCILTLEYLKDIKASKDIIDEYIVKIDEQSSKIKYVNEFMDSISEKDRNIILMCYKDRMSNEDVGKLFNMSRIDISNYLVKLKNKYQYKLR